MSPPAASQARAAPRPDSPRDGDRDPDPARLLALIAPHRAAMRHGAWAQTAAALLWPLQALFLAFGLQGLVDPWKGLSATAAVAGFAVVALLRAVLDAWGADRVGDAAEAAKQTVRAELLEALARWSPTDARRPSAGVVAALTADALESLEPYLTRYEPARLRLLLVPAALLLCVAAVSTTAALILAVVGPLIPLLMAMIGVAAKRAAERQLGELTEMNAFLLDRLRALTDIRLLDAIDRTARSFDAAAESLRERTMAVLRVAFLSAAALELCAGIGVALTALIVAAGLLADPALQAAVGVEGLAAALGLGADGQRFALWEAAFLLLLAPEFFQPFRDFAAAYHDRAGAMAFGRRFDQIIAPERPRMLGQGAPAAPLPGPPRIRFDRVGFAYAEDQAPALSELSFEIAPGERVGLAGPSGAGKSTALALIAGLAAPTAGEIDVAGAPLDDETADAWRARLAWMGQRPHFLAGSLRANVAFFPDPRLAGSAIDPEFEARRDPIRDGRRRDARVRDALAAAAAAELAPPVAPGFGEPAAFGLDRRLGETGAGLSGGEGRRVGLARIAYAGRAVVLADEPTADLDDETRAAVIDGLLDIAEGATLIVASHDPSLLDRLDRVIPVAGAAGERPARQRARRPLGRVT